jgi:hypothetical protein
MNSPSAEKPALLKVFVPDHGWGFASVFTDCGTVAEADISALYLLAVPSTPAEIRAEALERAANGEMLYACGGQEDDCRCRGRASSDMAAFGTAASKAGSRRGIPEKGSGLEYSVSCSCYHLELT